MRTLVGNQDVFRFEVAVKHLLVVDVGEGVAKFAEQLDFEFPGDGTVGIQFLECAAVHPLHFYAGAEAVHLAEVQGFADAGVVEFPSDLEFFAKQTPVERVVPEFLLEGFEHAELSFTLGPIEDAGSFLGAVDAFEAAGSGHATPWIGEEKGWIVHL